MRFDGTPEQLAQVGRAVDDAPSDAEPARAIERGLRSLGPMTTATAAVRDSAGGQDPHVAGVVRMSARHSVALTALPVDARARRRPRPWPRPRSGRTNGSGRTTSTASSPSCSARSWPASRPGRARGWPAAATCSGRPTERWGARGWLAGRRRPGCCRRTSQASSSSSALVKVAGTPGWPSAVALASSVPPALLLLAETAAGLAVGWWVRHPLAAPAVAVGTFLLTLWLYVVRPRRARHRRRRDVLAGQPQPRARCRCLQMVWSPRWSRPRSRLAATLTGGRVGAGRWRLPLALGVSLVAVVPLLPRARCTSCRPPTAGVHGHAPDRLRRAGLRRAGRRRPAGADAVPGRRCG